MQIARASCSLVRVMRVLHPADPPSWRNYGTPHDLPKLGVAGSNLGLIRLCGAAHRRGKPIFMRVHRAEVMHWVMQISVQTARVRHMKAWGETACWRRCARTAPAHLTVW